MKEKAPFNLLCTREALMWRTEELSRNACDALERHDFTVAALLVRAITESAALVWKVLQVIETRGSRSRQEQHDLSMRLLVGWKSWADMPQAFNILTCLQSLDKKIPGVLAAYDSLSEIAHPNWSGVFGLYARTDREKFISYFGRGLGKTPENATGRILNCMLGSLGSFEHAYNQISKSMPSYLAELEPIWRNANCSGLHSSAVWLALIGLIRLTLTENIARVWLTLCDPGLMLGATGLHSSASAHAR